MCLQKYDIRKSIFSTFLVLMLVSNGCSSDQHLKFQGTPISGNLKSFTKELQNLGYVATRSEAGDIVKLTGKFLEKDCNLFLSVTKKSLTPYMIRVELPKEKYDSIKYSYERLRNHCASILGPGASKYQQFTSSSRFLFNEPGRIVQPKNGDFTRYLSRKGSVFLKVNYDYLSVTFIDRKNSELSFAEGGKKIDLESGQEIE